MKWRNGLAALIGIWFIISPWVFSYSNDTGALWTSIVIGAIQLIVAAWAMGKSDSSGWGTWQTWIYLLTGIWFIIQPFVYALSTGATWTTVILGAVTVILSLWTMGAKSNTGANA
ncbi:SPW repeat protein [Alicyclobacillus cycloheptanicus]|uniref:SPW repeat-containing integral membrane domain-containing protein n=1 Tax=Alicyclobacillus cycloheptanicus TaxID=1457 RepID=A0ABT9XFE8_9BACL|nr:SPW repeat protein [Alicyclobacillus cycloheptanicus]MDQ0189024.1 hypothetical protein [Alicyclobacillus cycloheptanicus]WDM01638.1 SPW repeat protein [Alicyclobacillus cycloheptanicus]